MSKVPEAYADARRDEILTSASEVFGALGFEGTRMRDIASRAGLSTGALYRYFEGKEALFRAMVERERPEELATVRRVLGAGAPADRLAGLAAKFVGIAVSSDERLSRNFRGYGEAATIPFVGNELRRRVTETVDEMAALVREAQASGNVDPALDPVMTGAALVTVSISVDFLRLFEDRFDGSELTKTIEAMISGLRPG